MKKLVLVSVVLFLCGVAVFVVNKNSTQEPLTVVKDIGNAVQKADLIVLDNPRPNDSISKSIMLTGKARGYWYFEASFPIEIQDQNGNLLGGGVAQAQGEWMTSDFVPFKASISFSQSPTATGFIVLKKDNPSGEALRDDSLRVPVSFLP